MGMAYRCCRNLIDCIAGSIGFYCLCKWYWWFLHCAAAGLINE